MSNRVQEMRVLVVHAHPDPDSFGASIRDAAVTGLRSAGHDVDLIDLYEVDYDPILNASEHTNYLTLSNGHPDSEVAQHIKLLLAANALVVIYPTFWSGMPAILKGWFDRTLLPDVAFRLDPINGRIKGDLHNIKRLVGITTYGSARSFRILAGDPGRRTLLRTIRLACGTRCRSSWIALDSLDSRAAEERTNFLVTVEQQMAGL